MEEKVKKEKKKPQEATCPEWMMTMGDAMSLLLCFFVLLLTFSTMEENKLMDVLGVLQGATAAVEIDGIRDPAYHREEKESKERGELGGEGPEQARHVTPGELSPIIIHSATIVNRFNEIKRHLTAVGFQHTVSVEMLDEGVSVKIKVNDLFKSESDEFLDHAHLLVQGFANLAGNIGNEVRININFSLQPRARKQRFSGEWGLAVKRSLALGNMITQRFKIPASRLGYGNQIIANDNTDFVELMLIEKLGVKEVSIKELLNAGAI